MTRLLGGAREDRGMRRRLGLLLMHVAAALACVPGCSQLRQGRLAERHEQHRPQSDSVRDVTGHNSVQTAQKRSGNEPPPRLQPRTIVPATLTGTADLEPAAEPAPALPKAAALGPVRAEKPLPPLVEALRSMLDERHQDALRHLQSFDPETQELLLQLLPTLTLLSRKRLPELAPQEVALLHEHLQGMLTQVRPRTELAIGRMCFCTQVEQFGVYQPLPNDHAFLAASSTRAGDAGDLIQLYYELHNFASELRNGRYETRLASAVEIRDQRGNVRKEVPLDGRHIKSLTQLHDCYGTVCFCVPPELEPGTYELALQLVDDTVPELRRVARKSIEFRVTAAPGPSAR
jgi:hypothetical protein